LIERNNLMAKTSSRRNATSGKTRSSNRQARSSASNGYYGDILGIAGSLFRSRQEAGAEKINALAGAARNFAEELSDIPNIRSYAQSAADQMENLSDYIADNSMEQIAEDAIDMAKRHPVSTAAFAVAVGFAFTRLMTHKDTSAATSDATPGRRATRRAATKTGVRKARVARNVKANGRDTSTERPNAA
jgi:hypothetical protein